MFKLLYSSLPASTAAGNLADKGSDVTTVPPAANRGEDMDEELPVDEPEQQSEANPDGCTQAPRSDEIRAPRSNRLGQPRRTHSHRCT